MSGWFVAVKAVVQPVAGALPALILVIFAGLLGLLGLACDEGKRAYALAYAGHFTRLAAVLIGARQDSGQGPELAP